MTLRSRLTVAVAVAVAVAIALSGLLTVLSARGELNGEVDMFLRRRVDTLQSLDASLADRQGRPIRPPGPLFFDQADAVTQILDPAGSVRVSGQVALPVDDRDVAIAGARMPSTIHSVTVGGIAYRMMTAPLRSGGAVQVARDTSEIDAAISGLTRRAIVFGVIGAGLAALVAWLLASRLTRPVAQLTSAAEHVARTQDLSASIEVSGSDEVGRLASSFNTMLAALETSRRQQHRLVTDASHELRTPLTSLRTNVELLLRAPSMADPQRAEILGAVNEEVDELASLVTELVDLATESSRPEEPLVETDLGVLVHEVAERFRRRSGRDIRVEATTASVVPLRAAAIDRAVSNLIDNAVKFAPAATVVDVTVTGHRVSVRDRGEGIAVADRAHVFDRFFRSTRARTLPGSGLGLAIVAEIVERHGGTVFADAPADGGSGAVVGFDLGGATTSTTHRDLSRT